MSEKMNLKDAKILVTPTSFGKNDPQIRKALEEKVAEVHYNTTGKPLSSEALMEILPGKHGYIAGLDVISSEVIQKADSLKVISRYGVGYDNVNLQAAEDKGIIVTNTPGANAASVAELALGLILSLCRHIPEAIQATREGGWPRTNGISLEGKKVAILGMGAIGKQLAKRLRSFDCQLMAYDLYPDRAFAEEYQVQLFPIETILPQADIISLHIPLTATTNKMVNRTFLQQIKKGALLVNTSRGELIDEDALLEAIEDNTLAGAALDAFSQEPPDISNPLIQHPCVLVTPHMGAHTDGATNNMGWMALNDCLAVLQGKKPLFPVLPVK